MKKQTQQTEQNPCQKEPSAFKIIGIMVLLMAVAAGTGVGTGQATKWVIKERKKNVTCHECDHVVARASASTRKKFQAIYGLEDKYELLWFCKEHPRKWDYAVGHIDEWEKELYFKSRYDHQVDKNGCEITNIFTSFSGGGGGYTWGTNGTIVPLDGGTITHTTNVGGTYQAKHLVQ